MHALALALLWVRACANAPSAAYLSSSSTMSLSSAARNALQSGPASASGSQGTRTCDGGQREDAE
eukprot:2207968-Pleurochrysis_carterae.AAC.1